MPIVPGVLYEVGWIPQAKHSDAINAEEWLLLCHSKASKHGAVTSHLVTYKHLAFHICLPQLADSIKEH